MDRDTKENPKVPKIFVSGSDTLIGLEAAARQRLDFHMEKGHQLLVGDGDGTAFAVQSYLRSKNYGEVQVFYVGPEPIHNLGNWPLREIDTEGMKRAMEREAARDRVMAHEADAALMVWDGKHPATAMNTWRMIVLRRTTVVCDTRTQTLFNVRTVKDWREMTRGMGITRSERLGKFLKIEVEYGEKVHEGMQRTGRPIVLN